MKFRWVALMSIRLSSITSLQADPQYGVDEGLRLYRANDMKGAITAWEGVLQRGSASGPLYYNLGNAYYRIGNIGQAILHYERARRLLPRDHDVVANLDIARLATVDRVEAPLRLIIWKWVDAVRDYFSLNELAAILIISGFLGLGIVIGWFFVPNKFRAGLRTAGIAVAAVYILTVSWYGWRAVLNGQEYAIVLAAKTDVCSAPDAASTQLFALHEGTKVRCGESLSGWINIQLVDGRKGWISVKDLAKI